VRENWRGGRESGRRSERGAVRESERNIPTFIVNIEQQCERERERERKRKREREREREREME
jgi:hypothetical protein